MAYKRLLIIVMSVLIVPSLFGMQNNNNNDNESVYLMGHFRHSDNNKNGSYIVAKLANSKSFNDFLKKESNIFKCIEPHACDVVCYRFTKDTDKRKCSSEKYLVCVKLAKKDSAKQIKDALSALEEVKYFKVVDKQLLVSDVNNMFWKDEKITKNSIATLDKFELRPH